LAKPVAFLHKSYSSHHVIHNFLTMIRKLTGVSSRTLLESRHHRPQKPFEVEKRVKKIHSRVAEMTTAEQVRASEFLFRVK
jgi:hypothetical protein